MGKKLFISEKPSVAQEFTKSLKENFTRHDGFVESDNYVVTWCVGHLVTMSYPEVYDIKWKKWSIDPLPFLPEKYLYEVIPDVKKQFNIVKTQLNRPDVDCIYVCTDSGREGEYIYRLVDEMAGVPATKEKRRVWIDSQTEEEIQRGIREAKLLNAYDSLSDSAYLRAKEDYLMGINFSRILSLRYGNEVQKFMRSDKYQAISVGRVMTCVLGMVVRREREIRNFVKTPFYRVLLNTVSPEMEAEFRAVEGSSYFQTPFMYKENGFKDREHAEELINRLSTQTQATISQLEKKKETKNPPLLFNLAELQNECSKLFKISPDDTLKIVQELYEKKLVTYPRTDARVLSTAVAKEISKNIAGLRNYAPLSGVATAILNAKKYVGIDKSKYTNDKQITDHYAIIPTGQTGNLAGLGKIQLAVYDRIVKRFLSIFCKPAVYQKLSLTLEVQNEKFFSSFKVMESAGYLEIYGVNKDTNATDKTDKNGAEGNSEKGDSKGDDSEQDTKVLTPEMLEAINKLKKGDKLDIKDFSIKEGETSPPKRYNSGSLILAMESAGQLIEDEELRAQIKGSGIGTSATRAEILNKLVRNTYLNLNKKTQIITPTFLGELVYEVVDLSINALLDARLTASWEKGLSGVAEGTISEEEYMVKLTDFIKRRTEKVKQQNNRQDLFRRFNAVGEVYRK